MKVGLNSSAASPVSRTFLLCPKSPQRLKISHWRPIDYTMNKRQILKAGNCRRNVRNVVGSGRQHFICGVAMISNVDQFRTVPLSLFHQIVSISSSRSF